MSRVLAKLLKVWPIVAWLDHARWWRMADNLVPGPLFKGLPPDQKLLVHWLCYILDAQRPYQEVWEKGGPVFAEVVRAYARGHATPLAVLERFSHPPDKGRKVDVLSSRLQQVDGERISLAPRYGDHLFSLAATLLILEGYGRSLTRYLAANWSFCEKAPGKGGDDPVHRVAFLLYLLSYWEVRKGLTSLRAPAFVRAVEVRNQRAAAMLMSPQDLQAEYRYWLDHDDRYHKRLWAAFRDYVKPGSSLRGPFLRARKDSNRPDIAGYFRANPEEMLGGLEIPGDVWNNRFLEKLFGPKIDPATLREWFEDLKGRKRLPQDTFVEQFDVSFDYAAYMCMERSFETCVFRRASRIRSLCPPFSGAAWAGKLCPVTAYLCGYEYPCAPKGCAVKEEVPEDLCRPGCALEISLGKPTRAPSSSVRQTWGSSEL